jgi:hypothetical protein
VEGPRPAPAKKSSRAHLNQQARYGGVAVVPATGRLDKRMCLRPALGKHKNLSEKISEKDWGCGSSGRASAPGLQENKETKTGSLVQGWC